MDEFGLKMPVEFDADKKSIEKIKKSFDDIATHFSDKFKTSVKELFVGAAKNFTNIITSSIKDVFDEMNTMLESSLLSNRTTRENAFTYGLSASESYGFEKAKDMLGIASEEDLFYMTNQQRQKFQDIMTKYAERYQKLYDQGFFEKYLEFQIEMDEFRLDLQTEVIEFFMNNKDTIKSFLDISMDALGFITEALGWIIELLGGNFDTMTEYEKQSEIASILNTSTSNVRATFNNNNTFNGTTDSQKDAYIDMLGAQAQQAIRALGG